MRTTLEIDNDVLEVARAIAESENRSLGSVISKLTRLGLAPNKSPTVASCLGLRSARRHQRSPQPWFEPLPTSDRTARFQRAGRAGVAQSRPSPGGSQMVPHQSVRWLGHLTFNRERLRPGLLERNGDPHRGFSARGDSAARREFRALEHHVFWEDRTTLASLSEEQRIRVATHYQVTDRHLLSLAEAHGGRLVTLDRKLARIAPPGAKHLLSIPTSS